MISSEVQRTLVKSPPELWTELSDPKALARHLGDFGDIRITRSEPEQMVEWESDRARGRVVLKPSGWGTKVTLTVTGELPLEPSAAAAAAAGDDGSGAPAEPAEQAVSASEMHPPGEPAGSGASEIHPPGEPEGADARGLDAGTLGAEGADGPAVETEPAPPADSDPIAAVDPPAIADAIADADLMADPGALTDSDWPERPLAELVPPPLSAAAIAAETSAEARPEPSTPPAPTLPADQPRAAEPRRGFFARLLKRGRPEGALPVLASDERVGAGTAVPVEREPPSAPAPVAEPPVLEHTGPLPSPAAFPPAPPAERTEAQGSPPEPAVVEPAVTEPTGLEPSVASGAVDVPDRPVVVASQAPAETDAESAQGGETSGTAPQSAVERLSSELRTAEETTEEHVRMVLTSVLDRLGSAHHRPFSRS